MAEFAKFLNKLPISACGLAAYVIEKYRIRFFNAAVILKIQFPYWFCLTLPKKLSHFFVSIVNI